MKIAFLLFIDLVFLSILSEIISPKSKKFQQPTDPDLTDFQIFKVKYNKKYSDEAEEKKRFQIFKENLKTTKQNMKDLNIETTHKGKISKFADLTYEEFSSKYLNTKLSTDSNVKVNASPKQPQPGSTVPIIDLTSTQSPVKDQGQCGSCYAFAAIAALESSYYSQKQAVLQFSEQQIVDCDSSNYGCNGGWSDVALQYLVSNGIKTNSDYPYTASAGQCRAISFVSVGKPTNIQKFRSLTASQLCNQLSTTNRPLIVYMYANRDLQLYVGGVLNPKCGKTATNHAVLLVGCGKDSTGAYYLKVKNSWGTWGEKGYFRIRPDICGIGSEAITAGFS